MKSFEFNNKSSLTILDDELFVCEFETNETLPATTREVVKGEINKYRSVSNYFGVKDSDSLTLPIGLVKKTGKPFSIIERDVIEGWLTDNDIPFSEVLIVDSIPTLKLFLLFSHPANPKTVKKHIKIVNIFFFIINPPYNK